MTNKSYKIQEIPIISSILIKIKEIIGILKKSPLFHSILKHSSENIAPSKFLYDIFTNNDYDGIGDACDDNTILPQFPCENGLANGHPCSGFDLMSHIPIDVLGGDGCVNLKPFEIPIEPYFTSNL